MIEAIGDDSFEHALARYLHALCGADHFAAFRVGTAELREVAASCVDPARTDRHRVRSYIEHGLWRQDPAMVEVRRQLGTPTQSVIHVDFSERGYRELRAGLYSHMRDRLLVCGHSRGEAFGLSVLRADPHSPFHDEAVRRLGEVADVLVRLLAKHAQTCRRQPNAARALTDLAEIESCIISVSALPRRETQVCARVLYGMASAGTAIDLNVSEETVKTYRKRAYQRLNIGTERELLHWYRNAGAHGARSASCCSKRRRLSPSEGLTRIPAAHQSGVTEAPSTFVGR
ncbi:helix-turn-helix transcriptional regulator [Ramlibacter terrae]|uniref:Helix-turn-helix transcriptional regulator n=1 Tax=Ramlibacter terrae TaxID=2732511 RepID=A0ABX6P2N2_9BURK|nr:helix-turn-helix transcriptional regulator [Ramlibacter terrae]